jgi:hypothetical protein
VIRTLASWLLSLVVVATFLWGGCVSCEQYFMFPGKHQTCCNKSGQCERPGKTPGKPERQDCNRLPFSRSGQAHVLPLPAILPVFVATQLEQSASAGLLRVESFDVVVDPSPPDRQAFNATFLI